MKHGKIQLLIVPFLTLLAGCAKETNDILPANGEESSLQVELTVPGTDILTETKSSSTAVLGIENGSTIAFYDAVEGNLINCLTNEGSNLSFILSPAPSAKCNVYAVANTTFDWPQNESELSERSIQLDLMKGYIPRACKGTTWTPDGDNGGINHLSLSMDKLYATLYIKRDQPDGTTFEAKGAKVVSSPKYIFPFGENGEGESSALDTATEQDISLFNSGESFTLLVPPVKGTKVEITGTRLNGSGFTYSDTYTLTIPSLNAGDSKTVTLTADGKESADKLVVSTGKDTRSVTFSAKSLIVGDASASSAKFTVCGKAGNGDKDWTYTLQWKGNTALEGSTLSVGGNIYNLNQDGFITRQGDGNEYEIIVTTTNKGLAHSVDVTCSDPAGKSETGITLICGKLIKEMILKESTGKGLKLNSQQDAIDNFTPYVLNGNSLSLKGTITCTDGTELDATDKLTLGWNIADALKGSSVEADYKNALFNFKARLGMDEGVEDTNYWQSHSNHGEGEVSYFIKAYNEYGRWATITSNPLTIQVDATKEYSLNATSSYFVPCGGTITVQNNIINRVLWYRGNRVLNESPDMSVPNGITVEYVPIGKNITAPSNTDSYPGDKGTYTLSMSYSYTLDGQTKTIKSSAKLITYVYVKSISARENTLVSKKNYNSLKNTDFLVNATLNNDKNYIVPSSKITASVMRTDVSTISCYYSIVYSGLSSGHETKTFTTDVLVTADTFIVK